MSLVKTSDNCVKKLKADVENAIQLGCKSNPWIELNDFFTKKNIFSVVDSTHVDDDMDPEYSFPPDEEDIR